MLTPYQKENLEVFIFAATSRESQFLRNPGRKSGKTYLVNEAGFHLQAMGYIPYVLTSYNPFKTYYAHRLLHNDYDLISLYGLDMDTRNKIVILTDEIDYDVVVEYLKELSTRGMPMVGYID